MNSSIVFTFLYSRDTDYVVYNNDDDHNVYNKIQYRKIQLILKYNFTHNNSALYIFHRCEG